MSAAQRFTWTLALSAELAPAQVAGESQEPDAEPTSWFDDIWTRDYLLRFGPRPGLGQRAGNKRPAVAVQRAEDAKIPMSQYATSTATPRHRPNLPPQRAQPGRHILDSVAEHYRRTAAEFETASRCARRHIVTAVRNAPLPTVRIRIHPLSWLALVVACFGAWLQLQR